MEGNLEIMSGIRDKLNLLLELQEDPDNPNDNPLHDQPVIDKPKFAAHGAAVASSGTCPATVPLGLVVFGVQNFLRNFFLKIFFREVKQSVYHE